MNGPSLEVPMSPSGEDKCFEQLLEEFGKAHKRRGRSLEAHMKEAERILAVGLSLNVRHAPISARLKDEEKAKRTLRRRRKDRKQLQDLKELIERGKPGSWQQYCRQWNMEDKVEEAKPFGSVDDMFEAMHDLVGIRISIYFPSDVPKVVEFLQENFKIQEKPSQKGGISRDFQKIRKHVERQRQIQEASEHDRVKMEQMDRTSSAPEMTFSGYKATHVVVQHKSRDFDQYAASDPDVDIEIQIGSIIMHAWSDIEHDILYKPSATSETSPDVVRMLDLINGIVMTGEVALQQLASVAAAEATRQADDRKQMAVNHHFLGPWFFKYFEEQKLAPPHSTDAWSRSMPWLFDVLKARGQHTYGNIEMLLKDMKAEPAAKEPLPVQIMQHLGKKTWPLQDQIFPPANYTTVWNARYWATQLVNTLNVALYMGLWDMFPKIFNLVIEGSGFKNQRPHMAEFLGLLHPIKPLRLSGREDLMVGFCKAILQANYENYPSFVTALRLASAGYVACPRLSEDDEKVLSGSTSEKQQTVFVPSRLKWLAFGYNWWFRMALSIVDEELRDDSALFLALRPSPRHSGIWKPVKQQGQKWDIFHRPFVHTKSLEFGNDVAADYNFKSLYIALGLEYDVKAARSLVELWRSLELNHHDLAASYLLVLKDVVGPDAHKIKALIKLTKALNINTTKDVRVVAELARDLNTTDADELKEYRDLSQLLGEKDPEELRALRQLSKENKTTDIVELRKLLEKQIVVQRHKALKEWMEG